MSWRKEGPAVEADHMPAPRTRLNVPVNFRKSYAREETVGSLKNISLTGAFLAHRGESMRAGEKVHLTFTVSGRERQIQAVIVWSNSFGSGIKFLPQNNRDVQIVDDLIYFVEEKKTGTRSVLDEIFRKVA